MQGWIEIGVADTDAFVEHAPGDVLAGEGVGHGAERGVDLGSWAEPVLLTVAVGVVGIRAADPEDERAGPVAGAAAEQVLGDGRDDVLHGGGADLVEPAFFEAVDVLDEGGVLVGEAVPGEILVAHVARECGGGIGGDAAF